MTVETAPGVAASVARLEADGVRVLSAFQEPYKNRIQFLVSLPIEKVVPAPFQRDISKPHVDKLKTVIKKVGRYLDPILIVRADDGGYWTPNGVHRWEAMKSLGARTITGILVEGEEISEFILALNTEKTPNVRDKALEVIRMYRRMLEKTPRRKESELEDRFEAAFLITLGLVYEQKPRFSGSTYAPILRKVDAFRDKGLESAMGDREQMRDELVSVDAQVQDIVKKLQSRGFKFPYLKTFVLSKCNPFHGKRKLKEEFFQVMAALRRNLGSFDPGSVRRDQILAMAGITAGAGSTE
ncbi:MAG: ParB N-terminal domain-containing protein [Nitrospirae bacterium]|nr:ParB N-terminal domain-containing protein [Nitrospirota bacterium]